MKTIEFTIEWMSCGGCAGWVVWRLQSTTGIKSAEVSHITKKAQVQYDDTIISEQDIFEIIKAMNYIPSEI